ncbi:MAG: carboxypeptidase regulatory-like domain-containing protein [Saprospiraceae bacterium]|nr:carboxypeptidase regulatory-like domain-containing protein [Saprospiraceae bacterium]
MSYRIIFLLLFTVSLFSCHKDSDSLTEETISVFNPDVVEEIQGDILGYVYDESNQPVKDATVQIYSGTTTTNQYGVFSFKNANVDRNGTYIRVLKSGYIFGSDVVYPDKAKVYSYIKILKLETNKSFESQNGGTISVTGGGSVEFAADGIIKSDGNTYNGKVNVTAKLLSPLANDLSDVMPGALVGIASNGNTVVLGTVGMVAVELRDENGNTLNLKPGKKAKIKIPALSESKPSTIPLWYFDESKGLWKEEGVATLINGNYEGEVSHFSFWNCDAPFPLVNVCGKVLFQDGSPAKQVKIAVYADGLNASFGYTDENGVFCGKMPKGKVLTFKILNPYCEGFIFQKQLGPFDSNTELDPFTLEINKTIVSGTVKCNGESNGNSTIVIKINDITKVVQTKENGTFEINLTSLICSNAITATIFAFDNVSGQAGTPVAINSTTTNNFILETCTNPCDFDANLTYDCEVTNLTANVTGGSGNFSYQWSTGAITAILNLESDSIGGTYCVTITEVSNNCSKTFCKQVNPKLGVAIGNNCQNVNKIIANVYGGVAPYTYNWSTSSTTSFIEISSEGNYCVTVTDGSGCTVISCKDITLDGLFIEGTPSSCDKDQFSLPSSPFAMGRISGSNTGGSVPGLSISITYPIVQSVFQTGFNFSVAIWDEFCEKGKQIQLPQFKGLKEPTIKNTTCESCTDGGITILLDNQADCLMCTAGSTKVFKVTDLSNDLSGQNNAQMLGKGEYYIVVTDATTGCYIAFRKVKVL